ncbi:interleukin-27 subunit beta [Salmo salar]|uniref:Interleukin-27 subunit beta n=1 Tax=Salmo salar TaxID=8030 RepID=A0A1S3MRX5_SALSA|nr:interleukin-27 subunit beta [Salmo salar]|eukprot:XP_014005894.1 PREDICTED: interleukin-27 subunit beta-like [Salmo salar]
MYVQHCVCVLFWLCVCAVVTLLSGELSSDGTVPTVPSGENRAERDPPSPPEVRCWSPSYPFKALCSWPEPPQTQLPIQYIATYSMKGGEIQQCHPYPTSVHPLPSPESSLPGVNGSSPWARWLCVLKGLKLYTSYKLNITGVNRMGSASHLQAFTVEDIVKPDPPVNVTVQVVPGKLSLLVKWAPPPSWSDRTLFPLKYQIRYHWDNKGTPHEITLDPFEDTKKVLPRLSPGRSYLVQVCSMELMGLGQSSDWSLPVTVTMPAH